MFNRFKSLKQLIGYRKAIHKIKHLITLKTLKHSFNGKKFKKGRPMYILYKEHHLVSYQASVFTTSTATDQENMNIRDKERDA